MFIPWKQKIRITKHIFRILIFWKWKQFSENENRKWKQKMKMQTKHTLNVFYASCIISCYVFSRGVVELTGKNMNSWSMTLSLGCYRVWNLRVAHVDPMSWSILARLDNSHTPPTVSSHWECVISMLSGFFMV